MKHFLSQYVQTSGRFAAGLALIASFGFGQTVNAVDDTLVPGILSWTDLHSISDGTGFTYSVDVQVRFNHTYFSPFKPDNIYAVPGSDIIGGQTTISLAEVQKAATVKAASDPQTSKYIIQSFIGYRVCGKPNFVAEWSNSLVTCSPYYSLANPESDLHIRLMRKVPVYVLQNTGDGPDVDQILSKNANEGQELGYFVVAEVLGYDTTGITEVDSKYFDKIYRYSKVGFEEHYHSKATLANLQGPWFDESVKDDNLNVAFAKIPLVESKDIYGFKMEIVTKDLETKVHTIFSGCNSGSCDGYIAVP